VGCKVGVDSVVGTSYGATADIGIISAVRMPHVLSEDWFTAPEVLGSIPGASRLSEKQRVWNGVHSAS
jgi:hypothetical protein